MDLEKSNFWRVPKIAKSDYKLRHFCLFVRPFDFCMEQLISHWTHFHEIW
jgi:hypothetical protein